MEKIYEELNSLRLIMDKTTDSISKIGIKISENKGISYRNFSRNDVESLLRGTTLRRRFQLFVYWFLSHEFTLSDVDLTYINILFDTSYSSISSIRADIYNVNEITFSFFQDINNSYLMPLLEFDIEQTKKNFNTPILEQFIDMHKTLYKVYLVVKGLEISGEKYPKHVVESTLKRFEEFVNIHNRTNKNVSNNNDEEFLSKYNQEFLQFAQKIVKPESDRFNIEIFNDMKSGLFANIYGSIIMYAILQQGSMVLDSDITVLKHPFKEQWSNKEELQKFLNINHSGIFKSYIADTFDTIHYLEKFAEISPFTNEYPYLEKYVKMISGTIQLIESQSKHRNVSIAKNLLFELKEKLRKVQSIKQSNVEQSKTTIKVNNINVSSRVGKNKQHLSLNGIFQTKTSLKTSRSEDNTEALLNRLENMIGLQHIKLEIRSLVNLVLVQKMRREKGLPTPPLSLHLVFTGNPGTGKTTIARLVAKIYKSLGLLSKGHLVEVDRAGLVGGYVGQTALKVEQVVNEAIGGVLFVDEAYALTAHDGLDYGREAIDTLLKRMEDNRNDFAVIVAGYTNKMHKFIDSNPGLKSRFSRYIHFDDYSPEQLVQIYEHMCTENNYNITVSGKRFLYSVFEDLWEKRDEGFGNGRLVRNIFEKSISNSANRVVLIKNPDIALLSTIELEDIQGIDGL